MRAEKSIVRRILPGLLLAMVAGQSMAQSSDSVPQAVETNPLDPERVLQDIVPQPGALFEVGIPQGWFDWKDDVFDKIGLKFGFSYQLLAQSASETLPDAAFDTAVGDWWGFLGKWTMLNRGSENEGTLVFSMFERKAVGNNQVPALFPLDIGSLTGNVAYTDWDFVIENLY